MRFGYHDRSTDVVALVYDGALANHAFGLASVRVQIGGFGDFDWSSHTHSLAVPVERMVEVYQMCSKESDTMLQFFEESVNAVLSTRSVPWSRSGSVTTSIAQPVPTAEVRRERLHRASHAGHTGQSKQTATADPPDESGPAK